MSILYQSGKKTIIRCAAVSFLGTAFLILCRIILPKTYGNDMLFWFPSFIYVIPTIIAVSLYYQFGKIGKKIEISEFGIIVDGVLKFSKNDILSVVVQHYYSEYDDYCLFIFTVKNVGNYKYKVDDLKESIELLNNLKRLKYNSIGGVDLQKLENHIHSIEVFDKVELSKRFCFIVIFVGITFALVVFYIAVYLGIYLCESDPKCDSSTIYHFKLF